MSVRHVAPRPLLRFRRFGGGYRREDVERVLGELRSTVRSLELELDLLRQGSREHESRLAARRSEDFERLEGGLRTTEEGGGSELADDAVFPCELSLDAGPFHDFESLSAFEGELARLPHVVDIHISGLAGERARIDIVFTERVPLLGELRARLPYTVAARRGPPGPLVLDVSGPA